MAPAQDQNQPNLRVYIGKLPFDIEANTLKQHFEKSGEIVDTKIKKNSRKNVAHAFLKFANESDAHKAIQLNGTQINGSEVVVQAATVGQKKKNKNNRNRNKNNENSNGNNNEGKNVANRSSTFLLVFFLFLTNSNLIRIQKAYKKRQER